MAYAVTTIGALGDTVPLARANPTRGAPCNRWTANVPPRNIGDLSSPAMPLGGPIIVGLALGGALVGAGVIMFLRGSR